MLSNKLVVGLTGGIGSGKTTVANLFAERGVAIIDTDILSRELTQPGQPAFNAIVDYFGHNIIQANGQLDRRQLRAIIFADTDKRIWLETLLHPLIRVEINHRIALAQSPYCIVVIPLLLETAPNPIINRILIIDATEALQMQRTQHRDNLSQTDISSIMKTQVDRRTRLAAADDIIYNTGSLDELTVQVDQLHAFYLSISIT